MDYWFNEVPIIILMSLGEKEDFSGGPCFSFVSFLIKEEFFGGKTWRDIPRLVLPVRLPAMLLGSRQ